MSAEWPAPGEKPRRRTLQFFLRGLAILLPPNTFAGAEVIDWIGLTLSVGALAFDFMRNRARTASVAPGSVRSP